MITKWIAWLARDAELSFLLPAIGVAYLFWYRYTKRKMLKLMNKIPGLPNVPIIGNTLECNVQHDELFTRLTASSIVWGRQAGLWKGWMGNRPYVFLYKAETVEPVLNSIKHIEKSYEYNFLHPWLGTGLLTSSGSKWFKRRKIITPAFHFKILDDFVEVFCEQSEILVKKLSSVADGETFNIFPYITHCALDIVCETAMGQQIHAQDCSDSEYVRAVYEIGSIIQNRQAKVWLQPELLFKLSPIYKTHNKHIKVLHDFSYKVIKERKSKLSQDGGINVSDEAKEIGTKTRLAFLDLLIAASQNGQELTTDDIREEVDTFMFEGHDTTSAAMSWLLFLLGSHPDIQEEVVKELDSIFQGSDRQATMKDLNEMKYLECCIKEALRLYPSVPMFARKINEDVNLNGFRVPAGTTAMIVAYQLHRDPTVFPHPESFNPNNFLPQNSWGRHPYAYIPFSAGPRNCIGQKFAILEEKAVISNFLRKYKIEAAERREDLTLLGELILRPKHGLHVKIYPRHNVS